MADLTSGERSVKSTNGTFDRQRENAVPATGPLEAEQTLADSEQTLADIDQTVSDAEQTSADDDQASAEDDREAAERDQAASDHDLAAGGDPHEHEITRDIRAHSARQREGTTDRRAHTAKSRLDAAAKRDAAAHARDRAARARDEAAEERTLAIAQYDAATEQVDGAQQRGRSEADARAVAARKRAAQRRVQAAEYRELAAQDRQAAAEDRQAAADDREQAANERLRALVDREALAREVARAETDPLTGARMRAAGLTDLNHEADRCRRTGARLVVAYVDVDGLKKLNDTDGHDAGDELLKCVVQYITEHMRSYDLVIRVGGDEFVLAMSNMTLQEARVRFDSIAAALASGANGGAISTGFAELQPDESVTELIARADRELIGNRRASRHDAAPLLDD